MFPKGGRVTPSHSPAAAAGICRQIQSFLEDDTMEIAEQFTAQRPIKNLEVRNLEIKNYDMSTILGYSIFAILFLIALYFDSMSPGTAPGDFASMTVTPQFGPRSALAGPVRKWVASAQIVATIARLTFEI
jgi:hypothetical protein